MAGPDDPGFMVNSRNYLLYYLAFVFYTASFGALQKITFGITGERLTVAVKKEAIRGVLH